MSLEEEAISLIGEIINNTRLPVEKIKSFRISWEYVDGYYLPNADFSFYETIEEKKNADTKSL